jgi:tRNA pseudouridine38-40 synthase
MARYQVIIAYDGTEFSGLQRQANARTVQGAVEQALRTIGWEGNSILAAGRTDAGVHASGQVVAFDFDWAHTPEDLQNALNANLPADVAARQVKVAADGFHPRYDAIQRSYHYHVFCQPHRDPLRERYAWRVWPAVSLDLLRAAADLLAGTHDFAAFGTPPEDGGPTIRQIFAARWSEEGEGLVFKVTANAYLYHMVRRMVSLQVEVGQGRFVPQIVSEYLQAGSEGRMVPGLAPPNGLFLAAVGYDD